MTPRRKKRLAVVGLIVLSVSAAATVAFTALQENMLFFISPSDVHAQTLPADRHFRLGGLVTEGSVSRNNDTLLVSFKVNDGAYEVPVTFEGILPDLFREGQGVIAHGHIGEDGVFHAREVLARHDETYMPKEVATALEQAGTPHTVNMPTTR